MAQQRPRLTPQQVQAIQAKQRDKYQGKYLVQRHRFPCGATYVRYKYRISPPTSRFLDLDGRTYDAWGIYYPYYAEHPVAGFQQDIPPDMEVDRTWPVRNADIDGHPGYPVFKYVYKAGYFEKYGLTHIPPHLPPQPELEAWLRTKDYKTAPPEPNTQLDYPNGEYDEFDRFPARIRMILGHTDRYWANTSRVARAEPLIRDFGELEPLDEPPRYYKWWKTGFNMPPPNRPRTDRREPDIRDYGEIQPLPEEEPPKQTPSKKLKDLNYRIPHAPSGDLRYQKPQKEQKYKFEIPSAPVFATIPNFRHYNPYYYTRRL